MLRRLALAAMLLATPGIAAPRVAVDIAPVGSIVARVMGGPAPGAILPPGASPHGHALRPSEAQMLAEADVVVWVGPALTPWLEEPIAALAAGARLVTLAEAPGAVTLPVGGGHDHGEERIDGHLWLDPHNAVAAARAVAAALGAADPENAAAYAANAEAFAAEMAELEAEIDRRLAPVRGRRFIVFHDAYRYFERRFDILAAGSVAIQDGATPGTARVAAIRDRVREDGVVCAFAEPQFQPKLLATVIEGTDVRTGVLDPLGTRLPPGPDLYPTLMLGLADSLVDCLDG